MHMSRKLRATYNLAPLESGVLQAGSSRRSLAMLTKHGILVLFVAHALTALSASVGQVTVHESNPYLESSQMDFGTESQTAPADSRQVFLDEGVFIGTGLSTVERFLGIPFALPP